MAEPLEIRGKPRPTTRFSKPALMVVAGGVVLLLFVALAVALKPPNLSGNAQASELYNVANKPTAEGLETLASDYSELKPDPVVESVLGPPLQGDMGASILAAQRQLGAELEPYEASSPLAPYRADPAAEAAREEALRRAQIENSAREAGVFFQTSGGAKRASANPRDSEPALAAPSPYGPQSPFDATVDEDPNRQARKIGFLKDQADDDIYNAHHMQRPRSPYQVMAGTVIPASLVTGINSDLPGTVIAQVTQNIYDTVTGEHLLIPQGARLLGRYDSVIAFGQSRALVVWTRIINPDGTSIQIENLPAADASGYAGLKDKVDFHTFRLLKGIVLSTLLGVGTELSFDNNESDLVTALRESAQNSANQAGQRIIDQTLNIQPTIKIRQGWPVRVIVNKDLILQPTAE